jgi:hypothetical protein
MKLIGVLRQSPAEKIAPLRIHVRLTKGGPNIEALLGSGASKSIINANTMEANAKQGRRLVSSTKTFTTVGGSISTVARRSCSSGSQIYSQR